MLSMPLSPSKSHSQAMVAPVDSSVKLTVRSWHPPVGSAEKDAFRSIVQGAEDVKNGT